MLILEQINFLQFFFLCHLRELILNSLGFIGSLMLPLRLFKLPAWFLFSKCHEYICKCSWLSRRNCLWYFLQNCNNPLLEIVGFWCWSGIVHHPTPWSTKHVQDRTGLCSRPDAVCFLLSGTWLFRIWRGKIVDIAESSGCTSLWSLGVNLMFLLSELDFYKLCYGCALKFRGNLVCLSAEGSRAEDFCLVWAVLLLYDMGSEI